MMQKWKCRGFAAASCLLLALWAAMMWQGAGAVQELEEQEQSLHQMQEEYAALERLQEEHPDVPRIANKLQVLQDVGLGYVRLGQSATTLSGGEAQRVKLATELSRRSTGKTLYILDEPTTGLHTADIHKLLGILQRLVDGGDSVVVIEHNLDVIKSADHIVDLGPEGGDKGGTIVAQGTPEEIVQVTESYTGRFLKPLLE